MNARTLGDQIHRQQRLLRLALGWPPSAPLTLVHRRAPSAARGGLVRARGWWLGAGERQRWLGDDLEQAALTLQALADDGADIARWEAA